MDPFVLDPLTTACMLALVDFMEEGSKLEIENNFIEFTRPSAVATATRFVWSCLREGYSREALAHLRKPVARAILWYEDTAPTIFHHAGKGVRKLIDTYKGRTSLATESLTLCLLTIEKHKEIPPLLHLPGDNLRKEQLRRLRDMWSDAEVRCLEGWFRKLENEAGSREQHIRSIREFLHLKQPLLRVVIRDTAV